MSSWGFPLQESRLTLRIAVCGLGATVGLVIIKDLEQVQKLKSLVITWLGQFYAIFVVSQSAPNSDNRSCVLVLAPLTDMLIAIPLVAYLVSSLTRKIPHRY